MITAQTTAPTLRNLIIGGCIVIGALGFLGATSMNSCSSNFEPKEIPAIPDTQPVVEDGFNHIADSPAATQPAPVVTVKIAQESPQNRVLVHSDGTVEVHGTSTVKIHEQGQRAETRPSFERRDNAGAAGAGMTSTGSDLDVKQAGTAPGVTLPAMDATGKGDSGSTGQGGSYQVAAKVMGVDAGSLALYTLGGLAFLAGVVAAGWLGRVALGVSLMIGGIGLVACGWLVAAHPWLLVAAVAVFGAGVLLWYLVDSGRLVNVSTALTAVTKGVEATYTADPVVGQVVKDNIGAAAGSDLPKVKAVVRKIKAKAGVA